MNARLWGYKPGAANCSRLAPSCGSWKALYVERALLHLNINIVYSNFVVSGGPGPYRSAGPEASGVAGMEQMEQLLPRAVQDHLRNSCKSDKIFWR